MLKLCLEVIFGHFHEEHEVEWSGVDFLQFYFYFEQLVIRSLLRVQADLANHTKYKSIKKKAQDFLMFFAYTSKLFPSTYNFKSENDPNN